MSTIPERLEKLREKMQEKGIDIYIIPTADFHQSEYVGEHFKAREYITGFTGSAGTAVVSKTEARLWTDGRYFIQAAKELSGTEIGSCSTDFLSSERGGGFAGCTYGIYAFGATEGYAHFRHFTVEYPVVEEHKIEYN